MELSILHAIQQIHTAWLDAVMIFITHLGDGGIFWIATGIVMLFFKKTRRCGILVLLSMAICYLMGNIALKNMIARPRPFVADPAVLMKIAEPGEFSFPSGHTLHSFTAATVIFLHYRKAGTAALVLAGLIAFSRLYLFVHYPTDILGGMVIGISVAVLIVRMIGKKIPKTEDQKAV